MKKWAWLSVGLGVGLVLLSAVPGSARSRPANGMLPDGDTPPIVESATLLGPQRHNELLEADLDISASDNDGIDRFEYRWNRGAFGSIQLAGADAPTVDYSSTTPDSRYVLQVRAIDIHANASDWFTAWSGTTPSVPKIVVAGDSIASGYARQWFTSDATCQNDGLSYGSSVAAGIADDLPDVWAPEYVNIAWAGASIRSMHSDGADSCGVSHEAQVDQIQGIVDGSSWNIVVITAGINSTNWTDVIVGLTRDTAFSLTASGDRRACNLALHEKWNISDRVSDIEDGARRAVTLLTATTNASVFWTGYHDITGTELAPLWSPIGDECSNEMSEAMDELHGALRAGLSEDITWVDIEGDVATQSWAGWPHPNSAGHRAIAEAVLRALRL